LRRRYCCIEGVWDSILLFKSVTYYYGFGRPTGAERYFGALGVEAPHRSPG
jgi:hypothetical protein